MNPDIGNSLEDDDEWDDFQTGPFCVHWCTPPEDCDHLCECKHRCGRHDYEERCLELGCTCEKFTDDEPYGYWR